MDIKDQYDDLTQQLMEVVPFIALPTEELVQELRSRNHEITLATELIVVDVYNSGDVSGIICLIDVFEDEELACGLTHLKVSSKNPLFNEINNYQKKRIQDLEN